MSGGLASHFAGGTAGGSGPNFKKGKGMAVGLEAGPFNVKRRRGSDHEWSLGSAPVFPDFCTSVGTWDTNPRARKRARCRGTPPRERRHGKLRGNPNHQRRVRGEFSSKYGVRAQVALLPVPSPGGFRSYCWVLPRISRTAVFATFNFVLMSFKYSAQLPISQRSVPPRKQDMAAKISGWAIRLLQ